MEAKAQTIGDKEQTEFQAELRKLKEEERNEEAQAEKLVSRSEALKGGILPGANVPNFPATGPVGDHAVVKHAHLSAHSISWGFALAV